MSAPSGDVQIPLLDDSREKWLSYVKRVEHQILNDLTIRLGIDAVDRRHRSGPDLVMHRGPGVPPFAIELKIWRLSPQLLSNRVAEALSQAVRLRREFVAGVQLGIMVILVVDEPSGELVQSDLAEAHARLRLLLRRGSEDAGFDRLVAGTATTSPSWVAIDDDLETLSDFDAATAHLRAPRNDVSLVSVERTMDVTTPQAASRPPSILLVADEWWSRQGGISTFNRELAKAFAKAGCDVCVVVPSAEQDERDEAMSSGVTLVTPDPIPGVEGQELLLTRPRFAEGDYKPDAIIGHGRILGPYAYAIKNQFFPGARLLHVVHMDAERLEQVKDQPIGRSSVLTADLRRGLETELALAADLVGGVGPLLAERIENDMRGPDAVAPPVVQILPGLREGGRIVAKPPGVRQVLLIARAEDIRPKGIDIAAKAVAYAIDKIGDDVGATPTLIVRGVPKDHADEIQHRLNAIIAPHVLIYTRVYSTDVNKLLQDLWQTRLLVMPSRHEGFGLVGLEAIAAGVPVLVSSESGLGRALREHATDEERPIPREVLSVGGEEAAVISAWGEAIYTSLITPDVAFARAAELRRQLMSVMSWPKVVAELLEALDLGLSNSSTTARRDRDRRRR
jgi:glycosyltransferase involved in cell wall biosynthesis